MKIETVIRDTRMLAKGIRELTLGRRGGGQLPRWEPGAHVQVLVPLPRDPCVRAYSLIGDPEEQDSYRIAVQLEPAGQGGSRYLHEKAGEGDRLVAAAPANSFALAPSNGRPVRLVAGGVGITPLIAMMRVLIRRDDDFRLTVFARSRARIPFLAELETEFGDTVDLHVGLRIKGTRNRLARIADEAASENATLYLCGPDGFVTAATEAAAASGIPDDRVITERFASPARLAESRPFLIRLARSGGTVEVPARVSALDALEQALGPILPFDCRAGFCGTCAQRVVNGEPEHRDTALGPRDHENGLACICVSRAQGSELTLDL